MKLFSIPLLISFLIIITSCSSKKPINDSVLVKDINIIVDQHLLDSIYTNYSDNIYIPILFVKNKDTTKAKMRLRGDSSRKYGKKSLKIVFSKKDIAKGEKRKINFNSEWTDRSYIRQYISSKLMQKAGLHAYNSNFAKLSLNGQFWGLYLQVENMDSKFLKRNGLDTKGNLYKATKDGACLSHFDDIKVKWEKKTNKKTNWNDLQQLINEIDTISVRNLKPYLKKTFEYDKLISIIAMNMLVQHGSTYYHNYYLYHDINRNGKWQMFPWDMDKTLNFYSWKPYKYHETSSNWESDNPLIEKAFINPEVFKDIKTKVKQLSETVFNTGNLSPIIEECKILLKESVINDKTDQIEKVGQWEKAVDTEMKFIENQTENILNQFETFPKSFQLQRVKQIQSQDITLHWNTSKSDKEIKYKLLYGTHFLLENEETKTIENITDTFCTLTDLKKGKYYWRVFALDGENITEGFNTKSTFTVEPLSEIHIKHDTTLLKKDSPHYINQVWYIDEGVNFTVEAGCKLILSKGVSFHNKGNFIAKGTKKDSIWFVPKTDCWGEIFSDNKKGAKVEFDYCDFREGFFRSKDTEVSFNHCTFIIDNKSLWPNGVRTALLWSLRGTFNLDNSYFENKRVSAGEGMNIGKAKTIVTNSVFINMADAVEFLNINDGEISNNIILNSPDDAIDMNGCSNIIIKNNIIVNNNDKAISVGTEQYGPSHNIRIENNVLIGNKYGVSVKDSSFCVIKNTSFINNKTAIDARLKNNWKQYKQGGIVSAENCLFYKNGKFIKTDEHSSVEINKSVSHKKKINGKNNRIEAVKFHDDKNKNYNTYKKEGSKISKKLITKYNQL